MLAHTRDPTRRTAVKSASRPEDLSALPRRYPEADPIADGKRPTERPDEDEPRRPVGVIYPRAVVEELDALNKLLDAVIEGAIDHFREFISLLGRPKARRNRLVAVCEER